MFREGDSSNKQKKMVASPTSFHRKHSLKDVF